MPTARSDARFLTRWARRKAAVDSTDATAKSATSAAAAGDELPAVAADGAVATVADKKPAPALTDADMPPVESLHADSDFSGFLSPGVSEALRRRALRKLFACAVFNRRDGLDDYDDDFRHFPALGDHITSDMKHRMEMEAERAEAEAAEAGEATVEETADDSPDETPGSEPESPSSPESKSEPESEPPESPSPPSSPSPPESPVDSPR